MLNGLTLGGTLTFVVDGSGVTQNSQISLAGEIEIASAGEYSFDGAFGIAAVSSTARLAIAAGGVFTKNGAGLSQINVSVADSGLIVATAGVLDFTKAISGTGTLQIDVGATLVVGQSALKNLNVTFTSTVGTLALGSPHAFTATINDFASGDVIDLLGTVVIGAILEAGDKLLSGGPPTTLRAPRFSWSDPTRWMSSALPPTAAAGPD